GSVTRPRIVLVSGRKAPVGSGAVAVVRCQGAIPRVRGEKLQPMTEAFFQTRVQPVVPGGAFGVDNGPCIVCKSKEWRPQRDVREEVFRFSPNWIGCACGESLVEEPLLQQVRAPRTFVPDFENQAAQQFALQVQAVLLNDGRTEICREGSG